MKRLILFGSFLFLFCLCVFNSCFDAEKVADEMTPVLNGVESLKKFYQESNRLPTSDNELTNYCREKNLTLDLTKFSKFEYHMSSDCTITLDYELKSSSEMKGSFTIDI